MAQYTTNENLYKWSASDTKQTTITEMASNADKIDGKLNDHTSKLADIVTIKPNGTNDDSILINNALTTYGRIRLSRNGIYKIQSPIQLNNRFIEGNGATIQAYGCDGLVVEPEWCGGARDLQLDSYTVGGAPYPKTNTGIKLNGTAPAPLAVNRGDFDNITLNGWNICIDLRFAWRGLYSKIKTGFCNIAIQTYGQSVNNSISDSYLTTDTVGSEICLNLLKASDNSVGEGLMISNSFIGLGYHAAFVGEFLSLNISNCVIDLIRDSAFSLVDTKALCISNNWIYSAKDTINAVNLGATSTQGNSIVGNHITNTNASNGIFIGAYNANWTIQGNTIASNASVLYLELGSQNIAFIGNTVSQTLKNGSAISNYGSNNSILNNVGDSTIVYASSQPTNFNIIQNNASNGGNCIGFWSSIPTAGTYKRGDYLLYNQPNTGTKLGSICITEGTPGTWKDFGIIGASKLANQSDSVAADVTTLKNDFNALLDKLRTAGLM